MSKRFKKNIEDFVCEHCDTHVKGNGYTNHCPNCLWSKHVDVNPGDRTSQCGGMMRTIAIEGGAGKESLVHECIKCGHRKKNRLSKNDNFDEVVNIIKSKTYHV